MQTTLVKIKMCGPTKDMWAKLLASVNKTEADDQEIALTDILELNDLYTATWCLRTVPDQEAQIRLFAIACVRAMPSQFIKPRANEILEVAERFAHGEATQQELDALWTTHWDAASGTIMATARPDAAQGALSVIRSTASELEWETAMEGAWNGMSLAEQRRSGQEACQALVACQTRVFKDMFTSRPAELERATEDTHIRENPMQHLAQDMDSYASQRAASPRY